MPCFLLYIMKMPFLQSASYFMRNGTYALFGQKVQIILFVVSYLNFTNHEQMQNSSQYFRAYTEFCTKERSERLQK